jgi:ribosomal protein S21
MQIEVADDESEDQAVKRYMKCVVQSGVINKVQMLSGSR